MAAINGVRLGGLVPVERDFSGRGLWVLSPPAQKVGWIARARRKDPGAGAPGRDDFRTSDRLRQGRSRTEVYA